VTSHVLPPPWGEATWEVATVPSRFHELFWSHGNSRFHVTLAGVSLILADGILDSIPPGRGLVALAVLLTALSVYLFVRKKGSPLVWIALLLMSATLLSGYLSAGSPKPPPRVTITLVSPKDGEIVPADHPVPVLLQLKGARLVPANIQKFSSPPPANAGHIHILVDGHLATMQAQGGAHVVLSPGKHSIAAEFVDPYHRSFSPPIIDTARVIARKSRAPKQADNRYRPTGYLLEAAS
jgi:hypothetical protein